MNRITEALLHIVWAVVAGLGAVITGVLYASYHVMMAVLVLIMGVPEHEVLNEDSTRQG